VQLSLAFVARLLCAHRRQVLISVQNFADFNNENNDPYWEHDFESFEVADQTFFWKIEHSNKDMTRGSEDPKRSGTNDACADHHVCGRALIPVRPEQGWC
jgi:hypothetical protein